MGKHTIRTTKPPQLSVSSLKKSPYWKDLEELIAQIQGKHDMVERRLADTLEYACQAGELLLQAKKFIGHGGWLPYLKECGIPDRTASDYMRIAKNWDTAKSATLPDLSYRGAIAQLRKEAMEEKERLARVKAQQKADEAEDEQDNIRSAEQTARYNAMLADREKEQAEYDAKAPALEAAQKAQEAEAEETFTLTQDLIVAGYKVMAAKYHPDKPGGSTATMQRLNTIKTELLDQAEEEYKALTGMRS